MFFFCLCCCLRPSPGDGQAPSEKNKCNNKMLSIVIETNTYSCRTQCASGCCPGRAQPRQAVPGSPSHGMMETEKVRGTLPDDLEGLVRNAPAADTRGQQAGPGSRVTVRVTCLTATLTVEGESGVKRDVD